MNPAPQQAKKLPQDTDLTNLKVRKKDNKFCVC